MKRTRKYFPVLAAATLAAGLAVVTAPASRAQAQSAPTASSTPQASADTQQRLQDLEKEMLLLQKEIVSLKESETPSMKTAAYTQPAAAEPSANAALDQAPAAAPDAGKVNLAGLLGPTTISGFVDGYYGYNYNHPVDNLSGLRFFDAETNGFSFNMAELIVDKAPDATSTESRMGYHVAAGYGNAAAVVNSSDVITDGSRFYLKEAYGSYLAPVGKGLTVSVGKFVTPIGAEVIESNANWNYSRSILFYYAIPYYHFGANAKYVFNPKWSLTGYLVNGWNNSAICHSCGNGQSSGLNYGASIAYTPNAKWSVIENYFVGPTIGANTIDSEVAHPRTYSYWKQLSDTVVSYTPNTKWAFMLNGDYGYGPRNYNCPSTCTAVGPTQSWWGAAGYAKYTINPKSNFAARYEYYSDPNGYTGLLFGDNGHAQEVTATYSYNVTSGLLVRGEYRYDFASMPIFERGVFGSVKEQNTATLGFIYSFSSANAK